MSKRLFNFCAGPAALPEAVLQQAQAELLDWQGKGLSVMEMSHRSDEFVSIAQKAEQDLRDLLTIPDNYKVLFLQGGASQQFAQIPLNLMPEGGTADYIDTGGLVRSMLLAAQKPMTTSLFRARTTGSCRKTQPMCITAPTRLLVALSSTGCPRRVTYRW